jgi:hypothetical protein
MHPETLLTVMTTMTQLTTTMRKMIAVCPAV